ncbi:DNA-binding NarL/FixJ family response regulator [Actinokineospora baliensis]|uniref:hypothetical protein n=1 Tax=Actinokineospora baliensis TaxID=547056 RepID=UPI00195EDB4E|nr:hypothetical protein [Actinokineospora baliensis]MBM7771755.1 DNA-binding NarL/FixJ family response regulator [Actinokineospora baliensis]
MSPYSHADERAARRAIAGTVLGEELDTAAREVAVAILHAQGLTDAETAAALHLSTYTAARIRARLHLRARRAR